MFTVLLVIDLFCIAALVFAYRSRLTFIHPFTIYLFFHTYSFTYRAWMIYLGAPTLYSVGYPATYEPITLEEIQRAMLYADLGLLSMALGGHFASKRAMAEESRMTPRPYRLLMPQVVWLISVATFIAGAGIWYLVRFKQVDVSFLGLGSYITSSSMWPITAMALMYFVSGRILLLLPFILVYLTVSSLQGYHRFMTVLPLLTLVSISLVIHNRRWPSFRAWLVVILLYLVFPFMKPIGQSFADRDMSAVKQMFVSAVSLGPSLSVEDQSDGFLDQFAGYLTLVDRSESFEYGGTYLSFLTLPVPREWWPEKPGLADHIHKRATSSRPYNVEGRIITYLGQAYVDFGILGILFIPLIFGYLITLFYERSLSLPVQSSAVLLTVFLMPSLILAYRDGLVSLLLFGLVFNMPVIFNWLAHLGAPIRLATIRR